LRLYRRPSAAVVPRDGAPELAFEELEPALLKGCIPLSQKPGLGIELDKAAREAYTVS